MTFDEWFDKEGYDEEHRFVFGLAWNAGMNAAGQTGIDVDAPIRAEAAKYRWLRDRAYFDGDEGAATAWCVYGTCAGDATPTHSEDLDAAIDARMAAAPAVGAA